MIEIVVYGLPGPQGSWKIYTLGSSSEGVRYVGVTKQRVRTRINAHLLRAKASGTHKDRWLRGVQEKNETLICTIVEIGAGDGWKQAERNWIAKFRSDGIDLVNTTLGGEGCEGYRHSPEVRAAISERRSGCKLSPSHRSAISFAMKGRLVSDVTREKMKGRRISEETRVRMSSAQRGHSVSIETLSKMSAARKGKCLSDRARASRPKTLSATHRLAISVALKSRVRVSQ